MLQSILLIIITSLISQCISSISPGRCPNIEPIDGFDMQKFLGRWYAIQETSTKSSCGAYDFLEGHTDGEFLLEQSSEGYVSRLNVSYKVTYAGTLKCEGSAFNKMTISYPLIRRLSTIFFDVITTDYETHAAITTCQNVFLLFKRQSTTLLSRTKQISEPVLKEIQLKMQRQNIDDHLLKSITQTSCLADNSRELFKINSNPAVRVYESVENAVEDEEENLRTIYLNSVDSKFEFPSENDIVKIVGARKPQ